MSPRPVVRGDKQHRKKNHEKQRNANDGCCTVDKRAEQLSIGN